jgi:hypothetical protein
LAEAAYEQAEVPDWQEGSTPATYKLSKYFPPIVERLLITTDRQDAATANLRSAAYEALMEMIKNSPKDCYEIVKTTIRIVLDRLQQVCPNCRSGAHLSTAVARREKILKHFVFYKYFCFVLGLLKSRILKNLSRVLGENPILTIFTIRLGYSQ